VAVTLSIANRHASLPIACQLYLPKDWAEDAARRNTRRMFRRRSGSRPSRRSRSRRFVRLSRPTGAEREARSPLYAGCWVFSPLRLLGRTNDRLAVRAADGMGSAPPTLGRVGISASDPNTRSKTMLHVHRLSSSGRGNAGRRVLAPAIKIGLIRCKRQPKIFQSWRFRRAGVSRNNWPVVVGGCHRSGTSMLRRVLDSHPRIHCGPEVKFFRDFYGDYFNDPLNHLRFMTSARSLLPQAELLDVLGRAFLAVHEQAALRAGKARWADKNPENVLYLAEWRRLLDTQWLFVHVVRNPLDTLASIKERGFALSIPASLEDRIVFYRKYLQAGLAFKEAYPSSYFGMQYERLVDSPEPELRRLMNWLDETFEHVQLDFNGTAHQAGLEDPKVASTSRVHSQSLGRWRTDFTADEAQLIWSGTRDLWEIVDPEGRYLPHSAGGSLEM
jgi:hypothetical protein